MLMIQILRLELEKIFSSNINNTKVEAEEDNVSEKIGAAFDKLLG